MRRVKVRNVPSALYWKTGLKAFTVSLGRGPIPSIVERVIELRRNRPCGEEDREAGRFQSSILGSRHRRHGDDGEADKADHNSCYLPHISFPFSKAARLTTGERESYED